MPTQLFLEERRRKILEQLSQHGRVFVSDLSDQLNVSAVTIRQDLKALEAEGLLDRTHGGAVEPSAKPPTLQRDLSFDIRRAKNFQEKDVIGQSAAELIQPGYAIALDASTTVVSLLPYLQSIDGLTIVTNNLLVAQHLLDYPHIQVFLPSGKLRRDSFSVVGNPDSLPDINLNIGFVSAWGISSEAGFTEVDEDEMDMKQALLSRCFQKVALVDSSKWGQIAPYTYASLGDIDRIITTDNTLPTVLREVRPHVKHLQVVPLSSA